MDLKANIERELMRLQGEQTRLTAELAAVSAELEELVVASRVASRLESRETETQRAGSRSVAPRRSEAGQAYTPTAREDDEMGPRGSDAPRTFKDLVLTILETSYPTGLQASDIREIADRTYRMTINSNTLTVSLGRLKSDGAVRIDGRTWYWVPKRETFGGNFTPTAP